MRGSGLRRNAERPRVKGKIIMTERERRCPGRTHRGDDAANPRASAVDPIIEAPYKTVQERFRIGLAGVGAEAREHNFSLFRHPFAISVFEVEDVGRRRHKDAAAIAGHCRRPGQVVGVNRAGIEDTVTVGIFQQTHAAQMRDLLPLIGIVAHLDDEQAAIFVECHRDWRGDHRGRRNQFNPKAFLDLERLEEIASSGQCGLLEIG